MTFRSVAAVVALTTIAVGSRWYLLSMQGDTGEAVETAVSDYTLTRFTLRAMDAEGRPSFVVAGPFLRENAADGSATVDEPRVQLFQQGADTWRATAREGWIAPGGEEVRLLGDVVLASPAHRDDAQITAPSLTLRPTDQTASSDGEVTVERPGVRLSGVGADVDIGAQSILLRSRVRATYLFRESGADAAG